MDSHMCVTANGSTIPSTSSVLSQEMLHVDRMDALNQLFLRSHALRKEAMAIDVGRDKPVILVIGDDFIIHYKNRREIVPYMPRLYHDLKTLAHIPCGVENIDAMPVMEDTERREMKQGYLDAIDHILSEGETSPLSSYFDYLTTLQEIIRKNERIEDHLRELSGDLLRLIEAAARCRIDALP